MSEAFLTDKPGDGSWSIISEPVRGRKCGSCKACCTLVPVELAEGHKPANVRCPHLRATGCGIYENRPRPCWAWSCRWLMDASTEAIRRPDRAGYAIDPMLDTILADERPIEVIQIWCDPKRRDAHRDPALRAWLAAKYEEFGLVALVRWGSTGDGMVLAPPAASANGEWFEGGGGLLSEDDMREKLHAAGTRSVKDQITGRR